MSWAALGWSPPGLRGWGLDPALGGLGGQGSWPRARVSLGSGGTPLLGPEISSGSPSSGRLLGGGEDVERRSGGSSGRGPPVGAALNLRERRAPDALGPEPRLQCVCEGCGRGSAAHIESRPPSQAGGVHCSLAGSAAVSPSEATVSNQRPFFVCSCSRSTNAGWAALGGFRERGVRTCTWGQGGPAACPGAN